MSSRSYHRFPSIFLLLASTLVVVTATRVRADEEGAAPHAPRNVPTVNEQPAAGATGTDLTTPVPPASSVTEPTFESETRGVRWPNVPLLSTGATVLGISYLPAVVAAAISDTRDDKNLYVPVAGPWMMLSRGPEETRGEKTLLTIDGVAQGLGALMLLTSFMIPERTTKHWYLIGSNDLRLAPSRVGTGYGMGAMGRF